MPLALFGFPTPIVLMWAAAVSFGLCTIVFYLTVFKENAKDEMTISLFAFLLNMVFTLSFMSFGMYLNNILLIDLGVFSFLVASTFMLKFPLTVFSKSLRETIFYIMLVVSLLLFLWIVFSPTGFKSIAPLILWINLGINGIVTGFFVFLVGLRAHERWVKVKAVGGGLGVMTCCVASEVATLAGSVFFFGLFNFISPIILTISVLLGRHYQKESQGAPSTSFAADSMQR